MITSFIQEELSVFDFIIGFQFYFPQILHTIFCYNEFKVKVCWIKAKHKNAPPWIYIAT